MKTNFGELVKNLSKEKGITITQIAERIGISQGWLSGMLLYKSQDIPMKRVQEILNALDEDLVLSNGKRPRFDDYNSTIKSFGRLMQSLGESFEIIVNDKKYKL